MPDRSDEWANARVLEMHISGFIFRLVMGKDFYAVIQMNCKVTNEKAKRMPDWYPEFQSYRGGLEVSIKEMEASQAEADELQRNKLSVRLELQADFYAGIWAHYADHAQNLLEAGDLEEALNAASQIGDDRLQQNSQGYVVPDSFTHGSSKQRLKWFLQGYQSGNMKDAALLFEKGQI